MSIRAYSLSVTAVNWDELKLYIYYLQKNVEPTDTLIIPSASRRAQTPYCMLNDNKRINPSLNRGWSWTWRPFSKLDDNWSKRPGRYMGSCGYCKNNSTSTI